MLANHWYGGGVLTELCRTCAECCKHFPFVELTEDEIGALSRETGLLADAFTNSKNTETEEYFLQFQKNGHCIFLTENEQEFSCGVYASRPGICTRYPSGTIQQDRCDALCEKFLSTDAHETEPPATQPAKELFLSPILST